MAELTLADLCESDPPDAERPWLDRTWSPMPAYGSEVHSWRDTGVLRLASGRLGDDWLGVCEDYCRVRAAAGGWETEATPYMHVHELRRLCCHGGLAAVMEWLVGEPVGIHLNLCGWVSTERDWHPDSYLSGDFVRDHYVAGWVALDDISPDAGPFEYAPGSHRWGQLSQGKLFRAMLDRGDTTADRVANGQWPVDSERVLTPLFEAEASRRGVKPERFLAKKGEVLLWHPRLWHRGSPPAVPGTPRRAVIFHGSGVHHRPDMPPAVWSTWGGWFFPLAGRSRHPRKES